MPRYIYVSCCSRDDHNITHKEEGFEEGIRKALMSVRDQYKDFLFTSNIRGFSVLNPGMCVPREDEDGEPLWGIDPVHPLPKGYGKIAELILQEAEKLRSRGKKRVGGQIAPPAKRPRTEFQRPRWVEESSPTLMGNSHGEMTGRQYGRPYRGRYLGRYGGQDRGHVFRQRSRGPGRGDGCFRGGRGSSY